MELVNLVFNTCSVIFILAIIWSKSLEFKLISTGMLIGVSIIDMVSIPDSSIILVRLVNLCLLFSVFYRLLNKYKILRVYRLRETEVKVVNDNQSKD